MANQFVLDRKFAEQYERYFAKAFGFIYNETNCNDHGIDIMSKDGEIKIDIKSYQCPLWLKHFEGIYLEYYQKGSGRPGWLVDPEKETTHYLFVQDCEKGHVSYYRAFLISREKLYELVQKEYDKGNLQFKDYKTTTGYVLTYEALERGAMRVYHGRDLEEENGEQPIISLAV